MCSLEVAWLANCLIDYKPMLCNRYVDDTFSIYKHPSHVKPFFDYLNSQGNFIKFTTELEPINSLSFLDCNVTESNGRFLTYVFQKPIFTGLSTIFFSFVHPYSSWIGLKHYYTDRGFCICSTYHAMHAEFEFLRHIFSLNGFAASLAFTEIKKFESKLCSEVAPECDDRSVVYCFFFTLRPCVRS
jgi:hypothetical protein